MVFALFFAFLLSFFAIIFIYARNAQAATNSTINFQARILQVNGAVVSDGSYSVQFKMYNAPAAGTNEWTETQNVTTKNGYITASLGAVTPFASTIDWSQEHWLTMNVNANGEMGPTRMKITGVPYSFRSGQADLLTDGVNTLSASQLAQLAPSGLQLVNSANTALRINQTGAGNLLQLQGNGADILTVSKTGDTIIAGTLNVGGVITGNGSGLTTLNGTNISSGTVADARLSSNVTLLGNTFNGNSQLVQLNGSGQLPTLSGVNLTALNGSNISSGTVADGRLSVNVTLLGNTFNGVSQLVQTNGSGALPALSGANLTSLNGTNISSGTVADARLSSNVGLLGTAQSYSARPTFSAGLILGTSTNTTGALRWTGTDFEGYNGSAWQSLTLNPTLFKQSGNAFGAPAVLGTTDGNTLSLIANSITGLQISTSGNTTVSNGLTTNGTSSLIGQLTLGNDTGSPTAGLLSFNDATGSNGFSNVLGTATLTASRAINLPDAGGTLCLSNSTSCGFVIIGGASAQVDSTVNPSIFINKTGATGNILTLQDNGVTSFSVLNTGALLLQLTDTAAFNIKNAGGTNFFNVDTSGGLVQIGHSSADGTGVLLVLDTKNTAGDPGGQEGAMYYNSSSATFRCYENARAWTECLGTPKPNTRRTTNITYNGSGTTITAFGIAGDVPVIAMNTQTAVAATTTEPGMLAFNTSGANNNVASFSGNTNYNSSANIGYQTYVSAGAANTNLRLWLGVTNQSAVTMAGNANPAGNYAAFRYDTSAADATWKCITKDGTTQNIQNSGVAIGTVGVKFEIILTAARAEFKINGNEVCSNTTNLPAANTMLRFSNSVTNVTASAHTMSIGWVYLESDK